MQSTAFLFHCCMGPPLLRDHRVNYESNQGRNTNKYGKAVITKNLKNATGCWSLQKQEGQEDCMKTPHEKVKDQTLTGVAEELMLVH